MSRYPRKPITAARALIDSLPHPVKTDHYVWCDYHGEIHGAVTDYYQESVRDECNPDNWRTVYVLGEPGEEF